MIKPLILKTGENNKEILAQIGFSEQDSEFQLIVYDITKSENPAVIEETTRKKNKVLWAVHTIKIQKERKIELKLTEFLQKGGTLVATEKVCT